MQFSLLGSGSSGNAAIIVTPRAKVLVDCGLSLRQLRLRAEQVGVSLEGLSAVFITHEHGDHVNGLGVLTRQMEVPVYLTAGTRDALPTGVGSLNSARIIEPGDCVTVGDIEVESYSVSHDAAEPVSYVARRNDAKIGFATDLGHVSHVVRRSLSGAHALVLESNYCPQRLMEGAYPPQIQHRIRSRIGHLSNQDMCSLLAELLHDRLGTVVLVHMSESNNTPELAHRMAAKVIGPRPVRLHLAEQDRPSPLFEVTP